MEAVWDEFLREAPSSAHAVEVYSNADDLAASVASYFAEGFDRGEPVIAVATADHLTEFAARLAPLGHDVTEHERSGLLILADAETTLAEFMVDGEPSGPAFEDVVGGLLDRAAAAFPGARPRVFGEMVDLLCARGNVAAAIALEELWNDAGRRRDFSLLCGYHVDVFDREAQAGLLPDVCRLHSHVLPAHDPVRLSRAVDAALEEVLGTAGAGQVYVLIADQMRNARVPTPQLVMMWVSANMPLLAERVLTAARGRYLDLPQTEASSTTAAAAPHGVDPRWHTTLRTATRPNRSLLFSDLG